MPIFDLPHPDWRPASIAELVADTGLTEEQAREAVAGLIAKGLARKIGPDEYQITVGGVDRAQGESN